MASVGKSQSVIDHAARVRVAMGLYQEWERAVLAEMDIPLPQVGSVWCWEPLKDHARQEVTVIEVKWSGEQWWITSTDAEGEVALNDFGRWIEATVLVRGAEE